MFLTAKVKLLNLLKASYGTDFSSCWDSLIALCNQIKKNVAVKNFVTKTRHRCNKRWKKLTELSKAKQPISYNHVEVEVAVRKQRAFLDRVPQCKKNVFFSLS